MELYFIPLGGFYKTDSSVSYHYMANCLGPVYGPFLNKKSLIEAARQLIKTSGVKIKILVFNGEIEEISESGLVEEKSSLPKRRIAVI